MYPTMQEFAEELIAEGAHKVEIEVETNIQAVRGYETSVSQVVEMRVVNDTSHYVRLKPTVVEGRVVSCPIDDIDMHWAVVMVRAVTGRPRS